MGGHECEAIVAYRKQYLKMVNSICSSYLLSPPCSDERACILPEDAEIRKKLMTIFHVKIFNINEGHGWRGQETSLLSSLKLRGQESW